jgi:glycosyltransferase involved in cell wall biosynthesis
MYIGRLDGWKGSDTFLRASVLLPQTILPVVIGGEEAQIAALSTIYPRVRFLGFRPYRELADNQAAADVLIVPNTATDPISVTFTSPLKLFAHMASNRPVIASDLPSIREIAGDTVYLVQPDSPEALESAIEAVLAHPDEARARAWLAYERVQQYSWESRAKQLEAFLGR